MIAPSIGMTALRLTRVTARQSPTARRTTVTMSASAETLDRTTPDSKWRELLTAEERNFCGAAGTILLRNDLDIAHYSSRDVVNCLSSQQYHVIRNKGTEPPGTGEYNKGDFTGGHFECRACGTKLYDADTKFNSGCGWPAFYDNLPDTVERITDNTLGMSRTEILCKNCGGHLGHVFKGEGFPTPTDERHCVNSLSIKFVPAKAEP